MQEAPIPEPHWADSPSIKNAHAFGDLMQRLVYTDDQLVVSVSNSLKLHGQMVRQSQSLLGRLIAVFAGQITDPDVIEIDGMRLQHLYTLSRSEPPEKIAIRKAYAMKVTVVRLLLENSIENMKRDTPPWEKKPWLNEKKTLLI